MTEAEWLTCTNSMRMLEFLRSEASSERKLRLFAAASFARLIGLLTDPRQRKGIEVLEQLAEGTVTQSMCRNVTAEVRRALPQDSWVASTLPTDDPYYVALMLYREFCSSHAAVHAAHATAGLADGAEEQREQARLMRCIFGNPFRPVAVDPRWRTSTVLALAESIYAERAFDRMPILADALEEAGCDDADILAHCRSDASHVLSGWRFRHTFAPAARGHFHVRGCWVVDLLLGKE